MRILITGASGYVGAAILRHAPKQWNITATYWAHPIEREGVAAFHVDVRDAGTVNRLFDATRPDVVIHTVALMSGNGMMETNAGGSRNIARAAAQHHARLIHLSSDVIFDGEHAPYDEGAPPKPITPYAESKARAEQVVRAEHVNPMIVRTSLVYGFDPMDARTRQTLDGEMPYLFADEFRCPVFVHDLADALIEIAAETSEVLVLNLAGPQRLSRYEFGIKLAQAFRVAPKFQPALSASSPMPRPRDCTLDISLAQRLLRTRLRGVDEVLSRLLGRGIRSNQAA